MAAWNQTAATGSSALPNRSELHREHRGTCLLMFQATIPQHYYHAGWNGRDLQLNLKDLRVVRSLSLKVFSTLRQAGGLRTSQRLAARVSTGSKMPYPSLMWEPHKSFAGFLATRTNTFKEKGEFPFNRSSGLFSNRYRVLNGWSFQPRWTELGVLQTSQSTL